MVNIFRSARERHVLFSSLLATCLFALVATHAKATLVAGDPSLDSGWTSSGNALDKNNYVIGAANFGFDMYTASFAADSSLAAAVGSGWSTGDTILAMGGKRQSTNGIAAGWGIGFGGDPVNSNVTSSARIVAKFGSLISNSVTASTVQPAGGNGLGSFSGGNLGDGAVLLGTPNNGGFFTSGNQGLFLSFLTNQRYVASSNTTPSIANSFGRIIYKLGGDGLLDSWEVVLDQTLLAASFVDVPTVGALSILTEQRGPNAVTDGLLTVSATAVPEAGSFVLGAFVCSVAGVVIAVRRVNHSQLQSA
ncbi:MAG TPA: hypothetical protein VH107_01935 [Lacipirellulaceae bacterium]|jgi:hypothetical protein|nr:hypothetical protein [Lacipirellulaceae bacterium]